LGLVLGDAQEIANHNHSLTPRGTNSHLSSTHRYQLTDASYIVQQSISAYSPMISGGAGVGFLDGAIRRVQGFWLAESRLRLRANDVLSPGTAPGESEESSRGALTVSSPHVRHGPFYRIAVRSASCASAAANRA
jgi:hypothetical protein